MEATHVEMYSLYMKDVVDLYGGAPALLCMVYVVAVFCRGLFHALYFLKAHFLQCTHNFQLSYGAHEQAQDSFVVVTGATSEGIGFALAEEWVKQGFSIALVGRSSQKLDLVAEKLSEQMRELETGAVVVKIHADLGDAGGPEDHAVDTILEAVKGKDVAAVVHAAGIETMSCPFTKNSRDFNRQAINVNATSTVLLTQALLPQLVRRVERGTAHKSALVFVVAGLALRPAPGVSVYAASKAMESSFAQATAVEFRYAVDVVVVHPLGVSTALMPEDPDGLMVITPRQCARATLRQLGHSWASSSWTNGWWFHELQWAVFSRMPDCLWHKMWMEWIPAKAERAKDGARSIQTTRSMGSSMSGYSRVE